MNYQSRLKRDALSECIRGRCERTAHNLKAGDDSGVDLTLDPLFYFCSLFFRYAPLCTSLHTAQAGLVIYAATDSKKSPTPLLQSSHLT
jgi:hypothetical protein